MAMKAGMKPFDALKAITINAAEHAGIADRVGSLEVGKDGDVAVYEGSPFSVEGVAKYVAINGELVKKPDWEVAY
jgi:imidazolonepropionase-like amidohydrolase